MPESAPRIVYEFGSYRLVVDNGLFHAGKMVHLPPKELGVLTLLVSRQGNVVPKQEIFDIVWAGDTQVSDESLTRVIYVLRKLFEKQGLKYVETLHRRGYRFAAPVQRLHDVKAPLASSPNQFSSLADEVSSLARAACNQGMSKLQFRHRGDLQQAFECFQRAIEIAPTYLDAYVGLVQTARIRVIRSVDTAAQWRMHAYPVLCRGLELAPDHPQLLSLRGWTLAMFEWRWLEGMSILDTVIRDHPALITARIERATVYMAIGQMARAVEEYRAILAHDPFVPEANNYLTWALYCCGEPDAALAQARLACERLPSISTAFAVLAGLLAHLGHVEEAMAIAERGLSLSERDPMELTFMVGSLCILGMKPMARGFYEELLAQPIVPPSMVAAAAMLLDGPEAGLPYLEQAAATKCFFTPLLLAYPPIAAIRSLPGFASVLKTLDFPANVT